MEGKQKSPGVAQRARFPFVLPFFPQACQLPQNWHKALEPSAITMHTHRHTISVLVENKFGVLARVAGMISGRGFNIDSLNVAPTHEASLSRITIALRGDDSALDLCTKQLRKLVNVVEVMDFKDLPAVARELVLVKVKADSKTRPEILQIKDIFRAKVVNVATDSLMIEATGDEDKVNAFLGLIEPFGIIELARTGRLALKR